MSFIFKIIGLMLALDILWWWMLARATNRKWVRAFVTIFMIGQTVGLIWLISGRFFQTGWDRWLPKFATAAIFIWHFIGIGLLSLLGVALIPILLVQQMVRISRRRRQPEEQLSDHQYTRREFLGVAAAITPALFTFGLTGVALTQLNRFRVRRFVVPIRELPRDLDGITIAQVSDMHVGRFTSGRVLRDMVRAVNELRADLVLLTGDLINDALTSLDEGIDLVRAIDPRLGLYLIEGNHDLIENASEFERRVKASGIPFLLDESAIVSVRGAPVQLLGLSWTRHHAPDHDEEISRSVRALLQQRRPDAFPILLAHHPHAFDAAAEAGMPLTLSGHTHGGQLMLNEQLGFGPALFRYWSGLYTRGQSKLIVSNGVGNWFPVRANAPAELIHITLRREA
ncbi:MAG TPA: metallophosphoesterase [Chthoniobacterales bacterium]|nr:metallophosphoesterase [Chthoniobacterales bacterium]